jgi:hypothetical protein
MYGKSKPLIQLFGSPIESLRAADLTDKNIFLRIQRYAVDFARFRNRVLALFRMCSRGNDQRSPAYRVANLERRQLVSARTHQGSDES